MTRLTVATGLSLLLPLGAAVSGCASGGSQLYDDSAYGAGTPEMVVGQFLEAANGNRYRAMANLFGTEDGPAERKWGRSEVEQRMFILASLLHHDSYDLRRLDLTEGPDRVRVFADMLGTRSGGVTIPFITVEHRGRWFVEQVITESLAGQG